MSVDRQQSDFLLRLCHEIRSPLRAVRAHSELLLRRAGSDEAATQASANFVVTASRRLDRLTDGLARYAIAWQLEQRNFVAVGADVILRTALARLEEEMTRCGSEVTYGELPKVSGSAERLSDVFEYLVSNAVRHSGRDGTRIEIACREKDGEWQFQVSDNGVGIEERFLESIFEPFTRLNPGSHDGPGLGLSICRAILERHGGRIWAEAREGGAFYFSLPKDGKGG